MTADEGTLQIKAAPAPKVTLYDTNQEIVSGFDSIDVTGYDADSSPESDIWYNLDTAAIPAGFYSLEFKYSILTGDGLTRNSISLVVVELLDPLESI